MPFFVAPGRDLRVWWDRPSIMEGRPDPEVQPPGPSLTRTPNKEVSVADRILPDSNDPVTTQGDRLIWLLELLGDVLVPT